MLSGLPLIDCADWRAHTRTRGHEDSEEEAELVAWFFEIVESFDTEQRARVSPLVLGSWGTAMRGCG